MRRLCYAEERINPIIPIMLLVINLFGIAYKMFVNVSSTNYILGYIGVVLIILLLDFIYFFTIFLKEFKNNMRYLKIKKEGTRCEGYIDSFNYDSYTHNYTDTNDKTYHAYTLNIHYGKNSIFKTPTINFNPIYDLGSRKCDVYVLNNEVYATGFKRRRINEKIIWDENDESVRSVIRKKKIYFEQNREGIIISAIFIILLIGVIAYQIFSL